MMDIEEIRKIVCRPDDTIVVRVKGYIDKATADQVLRTVADATQHQKILIFDESVASITAISEIPDDVTRELLERCVEDFSGSERMKPDRIDALRELAKALKS